FPRVVGARPLDAEQLLRIVGGDRVVVGVTGLRRVVGELERGLAVEALGKIAAGPGRARAVLDVEAGVVVDVVRAAGASAGERERSQGWSGREAESEHGEESDVRPASAHGLLLASALRCPFGRCRP